MKDNKVLLVTGASSDLGGLLIERVVRNKYKICNFISRRGIISRKNWMFH